MTGEIVEWIQAETRVYVFRDPDNAQLLSPLSPRFWLFLAAFAAVVALLRVLPRWARLSLIAGAGLALRGVVATQDPYLLADNPLYDDSFYCFSIARNLALGNGPMHDSYHLTSGFQPLFVFLIAPIYAFIDDATAAIGAILIFQSFIGLAGGWMMASAVARLTRPAFFDWALAAWAMSPTFIKVDLNGLETNLSFLMLATTVLVYLKDTSANAGALEPKHAFRLGALLGLGVLARVDNLVLAAALALHILLAAPASQPYSRRLHSVFRMSVVMLVIVSPWLAYSYAINGTLLPDGGRAVRFLSIAYGPQWIMGQSALGFPNDVPPAEFYARVAWLAVTTIRNAWDGVFPLVGTAILLVVTRFHALRAQRALLFLPVFYVGLFVAYTGYVLGPWFFHRYFHPLVYGYCLLVFLSLDRLLVLVSSKSDAITSDASGSDPNEWWQPTKSKLATAAFLAGLSLCASQALAMVVDLRLATRPHSYFVASELAKKLIAKDAVLGFFQSGILGYNWHGPFIGLDGKINADALTALRAHEIDRYIESTKLDYLLDHTGILNTMLEGYSTQPGFMSRHLKEGPVAGCYLIHLRK